MLRPVIRAVLLLALASAAPLRAAVDALEMIRRAAAAEERNWGVACNYEFSERVDARRLDGQGHLKARDVKTYDVMLVEGSPYRRLAGKDDRPLAPADARKEQEKLARSVAERRGETAAQRALRVRQYQSRPEWLREAWRELPDAFDFRLAGEERWEGYSVYVIDATPRPAYQPRSRTGKVLMQLQGKLWVDKEEGHLVKAEVRVVDTISVGLFLIRLAKGSSASFEQTRVGDVVWLPRRVRVFASARLGLLKVLRVEQEVDFTNGREYQAGSISRLAAEAR